MDAGIELVSISATHEVFVGLYGSLTVLAGLSVVFQFGLSQNCATLSDPEGPHKDYMKTRPVIIPRKTDNSGKICLKISEPCSGEKSFFNPSRGLQKI